MLIVPVLRLCRHVGQRPLKLGKTHLVDIANDRNHQAAIAGDSDADVVIVVINDISAFDRRIHHRELLQRLDRRLGKERHEAQANAVRSSQMSSL